MIKIKETKSVSVFYNEEIKVVVLKVAWGGDDIKDGYNQIFIPMSKLFQVKRGLESAVQRYYRKHEKRKTQRD